MYVVGRVPTQDVHCDAKARPKVGFEELALKIWKEGVGWTGGGLKSNLLDYGSGNP